MRRAVSTVGAPELLLVGGVLASLFLGAGLASPARGAVIALCGAILVLGLVCLLPPHLFLGASLAVLASSSAFDGRPLIVGSAKIYTLDLLVAVVLVRALVPRERRRRELRILDPAVAFPVTLLVGLMLVSGLRGMLSGNSLGAIARLETPLIYFPVVFWGFMRILGEPSASIPRIARALSIVGLGFIGYAAYARITHHPFGSSGIGAVPTTVGVLRRDYGFFSAFQLYALLALAGLAYLVFSRRATLSAVLVTGAALGATLLTLVRGLIFGVFAGAVWLLVLSVKTRWHTKLASRLFPLVALLVLAVSLFVTFSPAAARGVSERFLPGILGQSQLADYNTEYRVHALSAGEHVAWSHPLGLGFVTPQQLQNEGYPPIYIPHSQWGSVLVFLGWPGVLIFAWAGVAFVRRSFQLPAAAPWLHPLVAATGVLAVVQGSSWNIIFSQTWSLGMVALILALRFGLRTSTDGDLNERSSVVGPRSGIA